MGSMGNRRRNNSQFITRMGAKRIVEPEMKDDYEEVLKHVRDCIEKNEKSRYLDICQAIDAMRIKQAVLHSLAAKSFVSI
ncbi:hypothetical protein CBW46_000205 [Paenibacillus xerothermodurans]|uniref:Uncharacterized protein n=1 Tax=Paenibacillus xerothermodurans TaxID=1977292 RepID=A0A2W1NGN3_PAEXE|nr:hypothetical protein CBW46_000205 [Paenibacillus xerothermodurans]